MGEIVITAGEIALRALDLDHPRAGVCQPAGTQRRRYGLLQ